VGGHSGPALGPDPAAHGCACGGAVCAGHHGTGLPRAADRRTGAAELRGTSRDVPASDVCGHAAARAARGHRCVDVGTRIQGGASRAQRAQGEHALDRRLRTGGRDGRRPAGDAAGVCGRPGGGPGGIDALRAALGHARGLAGAGQAQPLPARGREVVVAHHGRGAAGGDRVHPGLAGGSRRARSAPTAVGQTSKDPGGKVCVGIGDVCGGARDRRPCRRQAGGMAAAAQPRRACRGRRGGTDRLVSGALGDRDLPAIQPP
jgi:hypothetical protein